MYVLMIFIHLLSTVGDVNVTDDCCTVKVMESICSTCPQLWY